MIRALLIAACALLAAPAAGQTLIVPAVTPAQLDAKLATVAPAAPDLSAYATKSQVATVEAKIPVAANAPPPREQVSGTTGTAGTYRPADAVPIRITRAGLAPTSSTGDWSITWSMPLDAVPVVLPVPVNASTQPVVCNVATRTMTGATGRCWLARSLPATLTLLTNLVSYDVFGAAASNISVQILAIPPTQ